MSGVYGSSKKMGSGSHKGRDGDWGENGKDETEKGSNAASDALGDTSWAIDFTEVQLGELVATGSFGVVHSGMYRGQHVAVKFLLFAETSSEDELNRAKRGFRQEVAVWHKLQHPNVVQFLGAYINPPKWAIVTEFLEGGTVKGFLSRLGPRKKLPLKQIIGLALDVARGMEYLHQNNIIHRDLKSANLLLNTQGVVKVADFGLARVEAQEPGNMTAETGTIRWMAPEMIDHKPYTRKVDVYSFAIVLWELSTAQWPFEGFSFVQLAHAIIVDQLRPPVKDVPSALVKLMTQCWDGDPEKRPDFSEIVTQLEKMDGGKGKSSNVPVIPEGLQAQKPVGSGAGGGSTAAASAGGEKAVNGSQDGGGSMGSSQEGVSSRHGPRSELVQDSGWKKLQVEPEQPKGGCCSLM